MNNGKVDWQGCFVAVVTPFTAAGEIDDAKFTANLELLIEEGADGLVVSGCTGESWALEPEERLRLFRRAVEVAAKRVTVIAGTGGIITAKVAQMSAEAKRLGADGVMILPPYYARPNLREVQAHYQAISDTAKVPILLYNIPSRTGINLAPDVCERLVQLEWVVAIKESSDDYVQLERIVAAVGDRMRVFTGHSAERALGGLMIGCPGYVSSMETQIMGRDAIQLYRLVKSGRIDEARQVQRRTLDLDTSLRGGVGTFPANTKAAMNLLGRPGGHVRPPLLALTPSEIERTEAVLERLGILKTRAAAE